jgi:hypothetical protein
MDEDGTTSGKEKVVDEAAIAAAVKARVVGFGRRWEPERLVTLSVAGESE